MIAGSRSAVSVVGPMRRERDLAQVLAIERLSFPRPWTRAMFAQMFERAIGTHAFVARLPDGQVTAYCVGQIVADELQIHIMAVHPRWRGRGLGRRLLARMMCEAARLGAVSAILEVRRSNLAARRLYEGAGFTRSGERPGYYRDPIEDALVFWRNGLGGGVRDWPGGDTEMDGLS